VGALVLLKVKLFLLAPWPFRALKLGCGDGRRHVLGEGAADFQYDGYQDSACD
jgi:hypothetical protein